jgi:hypothetical protein
MHCSEPEDGCARGRRDLPLTKDQIAKALV